MSGFSSKFAAVLLAASLCPLPLMPTAAAQKGGVRKPNKKQPKKDPAPPLPPYTPAPLEPLPLDQTPAVAPQVNYQGGELSIVAHNSTLADVLRAVRKLTGAEMEIPPNASERVVADIGPGPARDVLAELLNGTHFNYVMVGSTTDPTAVQSIALTPKSGGPETASAAAPNRPGVPQRGFPRDYVPPVQQVVPTEAGSGQDAEDSAEDEAADGAEVQDEQPQPPQDQQNPGQQTPKTPEQLLQELQRQQQQQQQPPQPGQPPQGILPNQPPTQAPNPTKPD
ncbi:MAG TPA: hypothetical protein VE083_07430 [Terriglobales bacterium]|nr:hypothetical protein [Terriglobales bacterium]